MESSIKKVTLADRKAIVPETCYTRVSNACMQGRTQKVNVFKGVAESTRLPKPYSMQKIQSPNGSTNRSEGATPQEIWVGSDRESGSCKFTRLGYSN